MLITLTPFMNHNIIEGLDSSIFQDFIQDRCLSISSINPPKALGLTGGVQNSSTSNHGFPNVFCGKRAPQLVISTISIGNQPK